ncbi:MAG: biotin/lipoate A/B protein ligase family protein [Ignavibacteria bacterium]
MSSWIFIDTGLHSGEFNMNFDLSLVERVRLEKKSFIRFYQWQPFAISLGYHQKIESLNTEKCKQDSIDIVRRPTGGRAILHSEELTYSVVTSIYNNSANELYFKINLALIEGFHNYDSRLREVDLEKGQIDFKNFYKSTRSIPCFSSSARNEIKFQNKKLVGSAQRIINDVILQHGSILIGDYHKKIVDYLNLSEEEKELLNQDLDQKTITLEEILNEKIELNKLKFSLLTGFEKVFDINLIESKVEI